MSAETAAVLPVLLVVAVGLCWLVGLAVTQMRVTDAAREVARSLARGDDEATAMAIGRRVAPSGSTWRVEAGEDLVVVTVTAPVDGPTGMLSGWGGFTIDAEAVAAAEGGP